MLADVGRPWLDTDFEPPAIASEQGPDRFFEPRLVSGHDVMNR